MPPKLNVLFVCSRNQWRSPTAERTYRDSSQIVARSAGTASSARRRITLKDLQWADLVLVMEGHHRAAIHERFGKDARDVPIEVLGISDDYPFMDSELIREIETAVSEALSRVGTWET